MLGGRQGYNGTYNRPQKGEKINITLTKLTTQLFNNVAVIIVLVLKQYFVWLVNC